MDLCITRIDLPHMSATQRRSNFKPPKGRANFIREWRKYRGYTQEQLAEMTDFSSATISQLENQKQDYHQAHLERIAEALGCCPADLIMRNPQDSQAIWTLWEQAKPAERRQIIAVVEGLLRASNDR